MQVTNTSTPRPFRRQSTMFPQIARYLQSSLTQDAFCQQENLTLPVFSYWLKKYKQRHQEPAIDDQPASPAFIPIQLSSSPIPSSPSVVACEIAFPDGVIVRFSTVPTPKQLGRFITATGQ